MVLFLSVTSQTGHSKHNFLSASFICNWLVLLSVPVEGESSCRCSVQVCLSLRPGLWQEAERSLFGPSLWFWESKGVLKRQRSWWGGTDRCRARKLTEPSDIDTPGRGDLSSADLVSIYVCVCVFVCVRSWWLIQVCCTPFGNKNVDAFVTLQ